MCYRQKGIRGRQKTDLTYETTGGTIDKRVLGVGRRLTYETTGGTIDKRVLGVGRRLT